MKRPRRDIKKIIWMKWRLLTSTKGAAGKLERPHSLKKAPKSPKSDDDEPKPKKAPNSPTFIEPSKEEIRSHLNLLKQMNLWWHSLKKHQGQAIEKRLLQKQGKKVRKAPQAKKVPKSPGFIESDDSSKEEEEEPPHKDKGKKIPLYLLYRGWKKKSKAFLVFGKIVKI